MGQGNVSGQGIKCGQNCWQQYPEHTQVTLTATAGQGAHFSHWQGDCQGNQNPLTVTVQAPTRCSAYFEPVRQAHLELFPKQYPNTPVEVGLPQNQQFELTNTGAQNLQLTQFNLTGSSAFSFQLTISDALQDKLVSPLPTPLTISGARQINLSFEVKLPTDFNQHVTLNFMALNAPKHTVTQTIHLATEKPTQEKPQSPVAEKPTQAPETPEAPPKEEPQLPLPESQPMTAATAPPCPSSGYIDFMCLNHGRTISHAVFGPNAYVAGGHLSGYIENAGMISQVTIEPDAVVSGGKLSGYIDNHGTLADFEFVGAAINGGQLAGTVYNHSPIGGVLKNVHFAAETYLQGGQLYGDIQGEQHAPPLLEHVVIQAGSQLQHLLMGEHVTWHEPVKFDTGVVFLNQ